MTEAEKALIEACLMYPPPWVHESDSANRRFYTARSAVIAERLDPALIREYEAATRASWAAQRVALDARGKLPVHVADEIDRRLSLEGIPQENHT